jgi:hypothetical protein
MAYLSKQLLQSDKERKQIARIICEQPVRIRTAEIFGSSAHGRRDDIACRIHDDLGHVFEHSLDDFRLRFLQVHGSKGQADRGADICNTSCDFSVGLWSSVSMKP